MTETSSNDNELVNVSVLVPKRFVAEVYRAVADVIENKPPVVSYTSSKSDERFRWWSREHIAQLKEEARNPTVLALLNLTAERADEWVSFTEVYQRVGRPARQAQGDLTGFTKLIKRLFKQNTEGWWPVEIQIGTPINYRMPSFIAELWKEAG